MSARGRCALAIAALALLAGCQGGKTTRTFFPSSTPAVPPDVEAPAATPPPHPTPSPVSPAPATAPVAAPVETPSPEPDWSQHDADVRRAEAERDAEKKERAERIEATLKDLREEHERRTEEIRLSQQVGAAEISELKRLEQEIRDTEQELAEARR